MLILLPQWYLATSFDHPIFINTYIKVAEVALRGKCYVIETATVTAEDDGIGVNWTGLNCDTKAEVEAWIGSVKWVCISSVVMVVVEFWCEDGKGDKYSEVIRLWVLGCDG